MERFEQVLIAEYTNTKCYYENISINKKILMKSEFKKHDNYILDAHRLSAVRNLLYIYIIRFKYRKTGKYNNV